jgi:AsmA protein
MFDRPSNGELEESESGMKGFVKVALIGVASSVIALAVAGAWFVLTFDPADYRDEVAALLEARTGREARVEGPITLGWLPLAVEIRDLRLAPAPGFAGDLLRIDRVSAGVSPWPLLRRQVEIDRLRLEGVALSLERRADGASSWDGLLPEGPKAGADPGKAFTTSLGGLEIAGGRVRYVDAGAAREAAITVESLRTGPLRADAPVRVDARLGIEGTGLALETRATVGRAGANGVLVEAPRIDLHGEAGGVRVEGALRAASVTFDDAEGLVVLEPLVELRGAGERLPGGRGDLTLRAPRLGASLAHETLTAEALSGEVWGIAFEGSAAGDRLFSAPKLAGRLTIPDFQLRALLGRLGVEGQSAERVGPTRAGLESAYTLSADALRLHELALRIDDTTLRGEVVMNDPKTGAVRFDLETDRLALDAWRADSPRGGGNGDWLDMDALSALDVAGTLRVAQLDGAGVRASDVAVVVYAD